jgi:hypothetical protein
MRGDVLPFGHAIVKGIAEFLLVSTQKLHIITLLIFDDNHFTRCQELT